jgi:lipoate-protein ligase A
MKHIDYKPKEGKLLRIDAEVCEGKVAEIKIIGDFFLYPEEAIFQIEEFVKGKEIEGLGKELDAFMEKNQFRPIGFSGEDIEHALRMIN